MKRIVRMIDICFTDFIKDLFISRFLWWMIGVKGKVCSYTFEFTFYIIILLHIFTIGVWCKGDYITNLAIWLARDWFEILWSLYNFIEIIESTFNVGCLDMWHVCVPEFVNLTWSIFFWKLQTSIFCFCDRASTS